MLDRKAHLQVEPVGVVVRRPRIARVGREVRHGERPATSRGRVRTRAVHDALSRIRLTDLTAADAGAIVPLASLGVDTTGIDTPSS